MKRMDENKLPFALQTIQEDFCVPGLFAHY